MESQWLDLNTRCRYCDNTQDLCPKWRVPQVKSEVGIWIKDIGIPEKFEYQNFLKFGFQMVRYSNGRSKVVSYVLDQPFEYRPIT